MERLICPKENGLFCVLASFQGVTEIKDEKEKLSSLSSQFEAIANDVLLGGCFEINGVRRIYPLEIEFYYHEEGEGGLKDPVVYHTNDHEGKQLDYYPLCSINCHLSGIDITFENKEKQYRASFLIREYCVNEYVDGKWVDKENKAREKRPTYLYEDMFMNIPLSDGINVKWVNVESINPAEEIHNKPRVNVAEYERDNEGVFKKVEISGDEYNKLSKDEKDDYFSYSGKSLKRCKRMWNYYVKND